MLNTPPNFLEQHGAALIDAGYPVVPIPLGFKYPKGLPGWRSLNVTQAMLGQWLSNGYAKAGVGVLADRTPAVDLDIHDSDLCAEMVAYVQQHIGHGLQRIGAAPKTMLIFRTDAPFPKIKSVFSDVFGVKHQVEILGAGQQFVAYAVHPDTGSPYEWPDKSLLDVQWDELPVITEAQAHGIIRHFEEIAPRYGLHQAGEGRDLAKPDAADSLSPLTHIKRRMAVSDDAVLAVLRKVRHKAGDYDDWVKVGMALHHQYAGETKGLELWDKFSQCCPEKYDAAEVTKRWGGFVPDPSRAAVTFATIQHWANAVKTAPPAQKGFHFAAATDVIASAQNVEWLVEGLIERNTTGVLFGDPASYKSFIALDLAYAIATGKPFHGSAVEQGGAMYIAGEGRGGLGRRLAALQQERGNLGDAPLFISSGATDFMSDDSVEIVANAVGALAVSPKIFIVDTLARNFLGEENSNSDMSRFISNVDALRDKYDAVIVVVHHVGHRNKERARGATALHGGADFAYRLERQGQEDAQKTCLTCTKMKDAEEPQPIWFAGESVWVGDLEEGFDSLVFSVCEAPVKRLDEVPKLRGNQAKLRGTQAELYALIAEEQPVTREALRSIAADVLQLEGKQFRNALSPLKEKNLVREVDGVLHVLADGFTEVERT